LLPFKPYSESSAQVLFVILIYFMLSNMCNSPKIPKSLKGRTSNVTLDTMYKHIESLEKCREVTEDKLQVELEAMLDNKFRSLKDKI
jgi:hypothetical protein